MSPFYKLVFSNWPLKVTLEPSNHGMSLKNVNNLENFHSKASKKQVYLSSNIYKQYKTKIFDRKAEQWRTEQEISGKFKKYFHEFLPRPVTFNVLI